MFKSLNSNIDLPSTMRSTGVTSTSPWANAEGVTDVEGDGTSLVSDMEFSAGTFDAGHIQLLYAHLILELKDGPSRLRCRLLPKQPQGETVCTFEENLKPELNLRLSHHQ